MVPFKWLQENEPSYLQNELQTLFDEKGWILIYPPPSGKPEWQPIETVWGMAKNHVRKNYNHADQTYTKMRQDLVKGFYGDKKNSYPGVTKKAVKRIVNNCEKKMVDWINRFTDQNIDTIEKFTSTGSIKGKEPQPAEFQFPKEDEIDIGIFDSIEDFSEEE